MFKISRFKQLKEQEARKKRQREEEIRKAEEAAAKGLQTNGKVNKEITPLEAETSSSNVDGFSPNGNNVNSELKDDERSSADKQENPDILDGRKNERSNLHMDKNIEKVPSFRFYLNYLAFAIVARCASITSFFFD